MTISVIIPAYNEEKYLPRTLDTIRALDRKPDEVIVIDGGSTDNTASVARSLGAIPVTVEHRGIGYARQKGLEAASGDIVAFTDADTIVPKNWLTKIEETLVRSGVVGVFGNFIVPDGWLPYRLYVNTIQQVGNWLWWYILRVPWAPGQNTAFLRLTGLKAGGYPVDYKIAEDIEMARRLMKIGKLVYRPDLLVTSSGRRGNEGIGLLSRALKVFLYYFLFRRADIIGFPDIR